MDKEIQVITEDLLIMDFDFIRSGQVKRLQPGKVRIYDDFFCFTDYGAVILNSKDSKVNEFLPHMKAIMSVPDRHLGNKEGFMLYVRNYFQKRYTKKQIKKSMKMQGEEELSPLKLMYNQLIEIEKERRSIKKGVKMNG